QEKSDEILEEMQPEDKEDVEELREFREGTAGGLMDTGFFALPIDATVESAMAALRDHENPLENLHTIFIVDREDRLHCAVPLAKLIFASGSTSLCELGTHPVLYVESDERQDRVA